MDGTAPPPFAALLRRYRLAAGLSQEALAERAGLSARAVSALERGVRRAPYRDTVDLLAGALDLKGAERDQLHASVVRRRHLPADQPAASSLPAPLTSFVGREEEQHALLRLLRSSSLVTISGTGGVGKTRLAMQVAAGLAPEYADGARLIELAPIADPSLVPHVVARALGVRELPGRPILATLSEALRGKALLLLLDNCEHVRAAATDLATSLRRECPQLRILATSREALGAARETVYRLLPLAVPSSTFNVPSEPGGFSEGGTWHLELEQVDSVRLFLDRAMAIYPVFAITEANADAIAMICRRLDGIPLAIELAAARVRIMTAEQIAARIDERFRLLTGGGVDAVPRHRTLRAALDWSYELLSTSERRLLERLAVFAGGCQIEAVEAVCAGDGVDADGLFDRVSSLVEQSLLNVEYRGDAARYRLLESIRQYAIEKLAGDGRGDDQDGALRATRERHFSWFASMAEAAARQLDGPRQGEWLDRLDRDHDNLRAALQWSYEGGRAETGIQLAANLRPFWLARGELSEGRSWLERMLRAVDGAPPRIGAAAHYAAGMLAEAQGDLPAAAEQAERSRTLHEEARDPAGKAANAHLLGVLAFRRADLGGAEAHFRESLALAREVDDENIAARALNAIGIVAGNRGRIEEAMAYYQEAEPLIRRTGNTMMLARLLTNLGQVERLNGEGEGARRHYDEALALARASGDLPSATTLLRNIAELATARGELDTAQRHAEEALANARRMKDRRGVALALDSLVSVARQRDDLPLARQLVVEDLQESRALGDPFIIHGSLWETALILEQEREAVEAARIFAAAVAVRRASRPWLPTELLLHIYAHQASLSARLGDAAFDAAWAEGAAMSPDEAAAYAVARLGGSSPP